MNGISSGENNRDLMKNARFVRNGHEGKGLTVCLLINIQMPIHPIALADGDAGRFLAVGALAHGFVGLAANVDADADGRGR